MKTLVARASPRRSCVEPKIATLSTDISCYPHQTRLVSVNKQNTIVFASCRDLVSPLRDTNDAFESSSPSSCSSSSASDMPRFNRIYVADVFAMHRLTEISYRADKRILRIDSHPSLPYFMVGDSDGCVQLWKMTGSQFDAWSMIYERHLTGGGAIFSTAWLPIECELHREPIKKGTTEEWTFPPKKLNGIGNPHGLVTLLIWTRDGQLACIYEKEPDQFRCSVKQAYPMKEGCRASHFHLGQEDMKVDVETYEVGPRKSTSAHAIDWRITSDSSASDSFFLAFSERDDPTYRDWTITKLTLSAPGSSAVAPRPQPVSCILRRSIVSMTVSDQHLLVFFVEGDYVCLEKNTLKDSLPSLIAVEGCLLVDQRVSTSKLTGSDEEAPTSTDRVRPTVEALRAQPSDFTKIPTSEFLKMLQAQTHSATTAIETASAAPSLSEDTDFQSEEAHSLSQLTRKRKSPGDDGTFEREPSSFNWQEALKTLSPRNPRHSIDGPDGRASAFLPPHDHVYHEFMGEPLIGYTFTHGMYGCVALTVSGVLGYLHLASAWHPLTEHSVSAILQSFVWKLSMHAETSDVLMDLLKVHEEVDDKPGFYQHLAKNIALACSRKNIHLHTYALNAFIVLLRRLGAQIEDVAYREMFQSMSRGLEFRKQLLDASLHFQRYISHPDLGESMIDRFLSSQTNDVRRFSMDGISLPYASCKVVIAELCSTLRYLFACLHRAAQTSSDDPWESVRPVFESWPLRPYTDPMFKLVFSKDIRHSLRRLVLYADVCLRQAPRDPLPSAVPPRSARSQRFLSIMVRSLLDRSCSLLDRAHKWFTWLDSKLSNEFDLDPIDGFTCTPLRLPESLSCLLKMMFHDLHVEEICQLNTFSFSHLLAVSHIDKFSSEAVFETSVSSIDHSDESTGRRRPMQQQPPRRLILSCRWPRRFQGFPDKPVGFVECLRCASVDLETRPSSTSCQVCYGLYRSVWKPSCDPTPEWQSILPFFGPL